MWERKERKEKEKKARQGRVLVLCCSHDTNLNVWRVISTISTYQSRGSAGLLQSLREIDVYFNKTFIPKFGNRLFCDDF